MTTPSIIHIKDVFTRLLNTFSIHVYPTILKGMRVQGSGKYEIPLSTEVKISFSLTDEELKQPSTPFELFYKETVGFKGMFSDTLPFFQAKSEFPKGVVAAAMNVALSGYLNSQSFGNSTDANVKEGSLVDKEPNLLNNDWTDLNDDWVEWYRKAKGCGFSEAVGAGKHKVLQRHTQLGALLDRLK